MSTSFPTSLKRNHTGILIYIYHIYCISIESVYIPKVNTYIYQQQKNQLFFQMQFRNVCIQIQRSFWSAKALGHTFQCQEIPMPILRPAVSSKRKCSIPRTLSHWRKTVHMRPLRKIICGKWKFEGSYPLSYRRAALQMSGVSKAIHHTLFAQNSYPFAHQRETVFVQQLRQKVQQFGQVAGSSTNPLWTETL